MNVAPPALHIIGASTTMILLWVVALQRADSLLLTTELPVPLGLQRGSPASPLRDISRYHVVPRREASAQAKGRVRAVRIEHLITSAPNCREVDLLRALTSSGGEPYGRVKRKGSDALIGEGR